MRFTSKTGARAAAVLLIAAATVHAKADRDDNRVEANLRGLNEVPVVLTEATGKFVAHIDPASQSIRYELSYSGLEGTATMAHLHLARRGTNGGIMVWLCQSATNVDPSGQSPQCPLSGSVSGVIQSTAVLGPATQGVSAGEFATLVSAIKAGLVYANVHSTRAPAGELRGQLRSDD